MSPPFIIADAKLQEKLEQANGPVQICTPDGRVLAYVTPAKAVPNLKLQPQISEEEIQRREKAGGGRKLKDILRDLENGT